MKAHLQKNSVLVLNRHWQAVGVTTPAEAFCRMTNGTSTALDIHGDERIEKVTWEEWMKLPVRECDNFVNTVRGKIRIPTVIVAARYTQVPMHRPKFSAQGIWERDGGVCQYTGQKLKPGEGNIDHVIPVSRGGGSTWENCVLSHRKVNSKKGNKLPQEVGLSLLRKPFKPRPVPATVAIQRLASEQGSICPDWAKFLGQS